MIWWNLSLFRLLFWIVTAFVFLVFSIHLVREESWQARAVESVLPSQIIKTSFKTPRKISTIKLTDDTGNVLNDSFFSGRWSLVSLGFTNCPDVCPFTLANLAVVYKKMLEKLAPEDLPKVLFVSVDPQRDEVAAIGDYVKNFNRNFRAATGSTEMVDQFVKELGGFYEIINRKGANGYSVNHSAEIFVVDPLGRVVGSLNPPLKPAATVRKLQEMISGFKKSKIS